MKQRIERLEATNRKIFAVLARMEGSISDMAQRMATKDDLSALTSRMDQRFDSVIAQLEDLRFGKAVHADTLKSHSERLDKLEKPGS